jgi:MFS family permease
MLVLLVRNRYALDPGWFGPALTLIACGATLAGVLAGRVRARVSARWAMAGAVAVNAVSYLALGTSHLWPVAAVALFAWGAAVTFGNITSVGIRQRLIPSELIGRVMGIFRAALGAGGVIGALASGVLASATSVGTVAIAAGLLQLPVVAALVVGLPKGAGDVQPVRTPDVPERTN